ncbi:MAG: XRE family transcriptional regulator [Rhodospirillaceae bacterium]|nr:MAG: XRE family transcriptional regulator [Rhodospirillaceae bacterium]
MVEKVDSVLSENDDNTLDPVDIYVGRRLWREVLRLSQEQVANAIGMAFQQIQKYEQGRNRVSASRLYDICQVLNIPVTHLFQGLNTEVVLQQRINTETPAPLQEAGAIPDGTGYMERTETLELIRAFWRILNPKARQEFRNY